MFKYVHIIAARAPTHHCIRKYLQKVDTESTFLNKLSPFAAMANLPQTQWE